MCQIFCIPRARLTLGGSVCSRVKSWSLPGNIALSRTEICSHCVRAERKETRLWISSVKYSLPNPACVCVRTCLEARVIIPSAFYHFKPPVASWSASPLGAEFLCRLSVNKAEIYTRHTRKLAFLPLSAPVPPSGCDVSREFTLGSHSKR